MRRLLRALFSILQGAFYYAVSVTSNNLTSRQNGTADTGSGYNVSSTVSTGLSSVYNITRVSSTSSSSLSTLSPTTIITNSSVGDTTNGSKDPLIAYITYSVLFGVPALAMFMICLAARTSVSNTNQPPNPRPRPVVRHFLAPVLFFDDDDDSGCGTSISQSIVSSDTSNNGSVAEENDEASSNVSGASGENDLAQQVEEENAVSAGGVSEDDILNVSQESYYDNIPVEGACGVVENIHLTTVSDENMSIQLKDISVVPCNGNNITGTIV
ncbi:hypothetical protein [Ehrlichia ruminantium]|uniref:hypothetical protein n=1 Tax=Ehrlichia ruminantium TaxID=779 RepID=UPI000AD7D071|nr:hypothetical protein [Ehrlichia ruminantium]